MTMEKVKKRKVYSKFRMRAYDIIQVPEIRLEGRWLEKVGFESGSQIVVTAKRDKIIITLSKQIA